MDQNELFTDKDLVSVDPVADVFLRVTRALSGPGEVLLRGTGLGKAALDQWKSGRRRPRSADLFSQVARNLRGHADRLRAYADQMDALAERYPDIPRPIKEPRKAPEVPEVKLVPTLESFGPAMLALGRLKDDPRFRQIMGADGR